MYMNRFLWSFSNILVFLVLEFSRSSSYLLLLTPPPVTVTTQMTPIKTTSNSKTNTTEKTMANARSIKINFQGESRDVTLNTRPSPTLAGLQAAVSSTFSADLPPRSGGGAADDDLRFTYKDSEGDDIVFDKDSELSLALRLSPEPLEISAARKVESKVPLSTLSQTKPNDPDRIYKVAARNLREYHGVPSMTPNKLNRTLRLLKLCPRRLMKQGLVPKKLLQEMAKDKRVPLGDNEADEDLAETIRADMELMAVEDDTKSFNKDVVEDVADKPSSEEEGGEGATERGDGDEQANRRPKMPIHAALIAADIKLRPREVRPLLVALGVHHSRFVKLGLIDEKDLPRPPHHGHDGHHGHHGRGHHGGKPRGPERRLMNFHHPRRPHSVESHPIHGAGHMREGGPKRGRGSGMRHCSPGGHGECGRRRQCGNHCG